MGKTSLFFILIFCIFITITWCRKIIKVQPSEDLVFATNRSSVPSVKYIVDAVVFLKQAFSVHPDVPSRAKLYLTLFQDRYADIEWSVLVGYKSIVLNANWYVETSVLTTYVRNKTSSADKNKKGNIVRKKQTFYMIFSGENRGTANCTI